MPTTTATPDLEFEVYSLQTTAAEFAIASQDDCAEAATVLKQIKAMQATVKETFDEPVKKAHEAHKSIVAARDKHLTPLIEAERVIKSKVGQYQSLLEDQRMATMRAEQERLEAEERARREKEAAELKRQKTPEAKAAAKELLAAPVVVTVEAPAELPKTEGLSFRWVYDFKVVDPNILPREYMMPNEAKIRAVVKADKEQANIPGVQIIKTKQTTVRG